MIKPADALVLLEADYARMNRTEFLQKLCSCSLEIIRLFVIKVLIDALDIEFDDAKEDTSLQALGAESIDVLDVEFRLKRQLYIQIKDHDLGLSTTVGEIIKLVNDRLKDTQK